MDELCDVGAAAEPLLPLLPAAAVLPSPVGSADAVVCVVEGDAPVLAAVPWLPACGSVDEITAEPAVVAVLPWFAVERLLNAREPMTAIPAKPPVVVTLRASDRRRWEWRLRWPRKPAADPSSGTNSAVGMAGVGMAEAAAVGAAVFAAATAALGAAGLAAARVVAAGLAAARAGVLAAAAVADMSPGNSGRGGAACARVLSPTSRPRSRSSSRPRSRSRPVRACRRVCWPEGETCVLGAGSTLVPHPGQQTTPLSSLRHEVQ